MVKTVELALDPTAEGGFPHIFLLCFDTCFAADVVEGYFYYFWATLMALLCLVQIQARCYCADRDSRVPPLKNLNEPEWGGL